MIFFGPKYIEFSPPLVNKNLIEVVRCRDCKYYEPEPYGDVMMCYCGLGWTKPDDYCSKGERKDNDATD